MEFIDQNHSGLSMKRMTYTLIVLMVVAMGCKVEPEPIRYGSDVCQYCHMTIVDKQHAAELVTRKGRAAKFDAIECMINQLKSENDFELFLIADYSQPGVLVDATAATYVISPAIPSPMGAFLSGFVGKDSAEKFRNNNGGQMYNWSELKTYFSYTDGIISQ